MATYPMTTVLLCLVFVNSVALGDVQFHPIFGKNMVLQRDQPVSVWGTASPGENVQIEFANQTHNAVADGQGNWSVILNPIPANANEQSLKAIGKDQSIELPGVLVGDIWLCGGQSNMAFELEKIYQGDIEIASANHTQVRLMTIPNKATPEPQSSFESLNEYDSWSKQHQPKGTWQVCSPQTVKKFAAIGYIFCRRLHLATGIPIGMIDNSVGGTTVEGWTSRKSLADVAGARGLLESWDTRINAWDAEEDLATRVKRWEQDSKRREARGEKPREKPTDLRPSPALDRNNPGASYNAMLAPLAGFRLKGIIFHQGYNNALADSRPNLYAETFKAMIGDWRNVFGDAALPFGIIELCAGADPQTMKNFELRMVDAGPYIREAQFKAYLDLDNVGWAAAYDQQISWYHPQMKVRLGERMARWALATQYDLKIGHEPAKIVENVVDGDRIVITFDREITVRDGRPIYGMAIAGENQRFFPAEAKFLVSKKDARGRDVFDFRKIEVSSPFVNDPVAVRYAWARCPLGNLTNRSHMERILPVPSFRTDDWEWGDAPFGPDSGNSRRIINQKRKTGQENMKDRLRREAELILEETTDSP